MADRGNADIRLEAAIAKMWNTEVGLADRGRHAADQGRPRLRDGGQPPVAAGERPDPVERMMRDFRINLIFEGSSEIMRLFIAREAVDTHLKVAGDLIDPKAPMGQKVACTAQVRRCSTRTGIPSSGSAWGMVRATANSARWRRTCGSWTGASRKLARTLFHCMVRFGPKLEKRQAVLGRLVEIGAELLGDGGHVLAGARRARRRSGDGQAGDAAWGAGRSLLPAGTPAGGGEVRRGLRQR